MKYANLIVGGFVVGFCVVAFVGFTVEAFGAMVNLDFSGLAK
jgi:hypothetical protein